VVAQTSAPDPIGIAWRRLDTPGHDAAILRAVSNGWQLEGAAAFLESGFACHLTYAVHLERSWRTRSVIVRGWYGNTPVDLQVRVDADRGWSLNGQSVPAVAGAVDIDLAFTPATNLLPIRRLGLQVGASSPVVAAWLPFPAIDLRPLDQVYHRVANDTYRYSSQSGTFTATLIVSPAGFVTNYSGLWVEERG
jgi:hypothetical protein